MTGNGQSERNKKSACHADEGHPDLQPPDPTPSLCPYNKAHVFLESHQVISVTPLPPGELSFLSCYAALLLHSPTGVLSTCDPILYLFQFVSYLLY